MHTSLQSVDLWKQLLFWWSLSELRKFVAAVVCLMLQKADNRNGILGYPALINRNKSYFYIIFLMGTISLACNDMTPEQMATNVNCSSPERHTRSYDYMEGGDVRVRRLFCRTQWYMRIDKRGKVKGTREANNNYSILEIRTVAVGIVAIKGVESEYFLAMNKSGRLYGKKVCNEDCNFIELIEENHYNTYASAKWTHKGKEMFVTLNHKGVPMKGKKTKKEHRASHFLPLAIS